MASPLSQDTGEMPDYIAIAYLGEQGAGDVRPAIRSTPQGSNFDDMSSASISILSTLWRHANLRRGLSRHNHTYSRFLHEIYCYTSASCKYTETIKINHNDNLRRERPDLVVVTGSTRPNLSDSTVAEVPVGVVQTLPCETPNESMKIDRSARKYLRS